MLQTALIAAVVPLVLSGEMAKEKGVKLRVVTGGTAARKAIADEKPEIVLSVACERGSGHWHFRCQQHTCHRSAEQKAQWALCEHDGGYRVLRDKLDSMIRSPEEEAEYGGCSEAAGR